MNVINNFVAGVKGFAHDVANIADKDNQNDRLQSIALKIFGLGMGFAGVALAVTSAKAIVIGSLIYGTALAISSIVTMIIAYDSLVVGQNICNTTNDTPSAAREYEALKLHTTTKYDGTIITLRLLGKKLSV